MSPQCSRIKGNGERCQASATAANGLCWHHDPTNAERRRRMASRAGSSNGGGEIRDLKQEVRDLIADVKAGDQDRSDAAVMLQGYRVLKDLVELERRVKETDQLAAQIEELKREYGAA